MPLKHKRLQMEPDRKLRVCLAASAGGHLTQLLELSSCWRQYDVFCVSTNEVAVTKLRDYPIVYTVGEGNRKHPFRCLMILLRCLSIALKHRPHVVISTGAAPACLFCLVSKALGSRIVWIDSIANVERLSLSGRIIRPFASLCLTQWPELAQRYRNVEYAGAII